MQNESPKSDETESPETESPETDELTETKDEAMLQCHDDMQTNCQDWKISSVGLSKTRCCCNYTWAFLLLFNLHRVQDKPVVTRAWQGL